MKARKVKKYVWQTYNEKSDMTFIIADYVDLETGEILSTEVTGFYWGEPSINTETRENDMRYFDGKPRATYNQEYKKYKVVETEYKWW